MGCNPGDWHQGPAWSTHAHLSGTAFCREPNAAEGTLSVCPSPRFPASLLCDGGVHAASEPPRGPAHLLSFTSAIHSTLGPRRQPWARRRFL